MRPFRWNSGRAVFLPLMKPFFQAMIGVVVVLLLLLVALTFRPAGQVAARAQASAIRSMRARSTGEAGVNKSTPRDRPLTAVYQVPLIYRLEDTEFRARFPGMSPEVVESLKDTFEQDAGVGELSPQDPSYAARWERAEKRLYARIRTLYGWVALGEYEREVALDLPGR